MGDSVPKPLAGADRLLADLDRFSGLSSEMIALLSSLYQEINKSAEELQTARSAVELERKEIASLREAEKSAIALQQQIEEIRRQKENLEGLISTQRNAWEAEQARHAREEKEYYENRQILREREEEEHRKAWAAERLKAQQMLEDELNDARQRSLDAQEAAEKKLLDREMMLKKKEQEWSQLIQALEQFLSKLAKRVHPGGSAPAVLPTEDTSARSGVPPSSNPLAGRSREMPDSPGMEAPSASGPNPDEVLMWENIWDERSVSLDERQLVFATDLTEEPGSPPSSSKDLHFLPGKRIEDQNEDSQAKRDSAPLKFAPRNSANHKSEE